MTQLTTENKTTVIMFFDGAKVFVTKQQADKIMQLSVTSAKGINLEGDYYSFGSISKIITTEEYYKQFPKKVPVSYGKFTEMPKAKSWSENKSKEKRIRMLEQMIKGITKFINNSKQNTKARKLKRQMETGLELIRAGKDFKISSLATL